MYLPVNGTVKKKLKDQQRSCMMMFKQFFLLIFFIKAYVVGTHNICFYKKVDKSFTGCRQKTT